MTPNHQSTDRAREIFAARHPGQRAAGSEYSAILNDVAQNQYNGIINQALAGHPQFSPAFVKSLLIQESNFDPKAQHKISNRVGLSQLGVDEGKAVGLTGMDKSPNDPRFDPTKAIPAAVGHLAIVQKTLSGGYQDNGTPIGQEAEKFLAAGYNLGGAAIKRAQHIAHDRALANAPRTMSPVQAEAYARAEAAKFDNLFQPPNDRTKSPIYEEVYRAHLGKSTDPKDVAKAAKTANEKYGEVGTYGNNVVLRAYQPDRMPQAERSLDGRSSPGPHANARGWDGKPHVGTMTWTDGKLVEQHIGGGQHMLYDRGYDLAGQDVQLGQKYQIDTRGITMLSAVTDRSHAVEVGHGR